MKYIIWNEVLEIASISNKSVVLISCKQNEPKLFVEFTSNVTGRMFFIYFF